MRFIPYRGLVFLFCIPYYQPKDLDDFSILSNQNLKWCIMGSVQKPFSSKLVTWHTSHDWNPPSPQFYFRQQHVTPPGLRKMMTRRSLLQDDNKIITDAFYLSIYLSTHSINPYLNPSTLTDQLVSLSTTGIPRLPNDVTTTSLFRDEQPLVQLL